MATGFFGQIVCAILFGFTFGGFVTGIVVILKKILNDLGTSLGLLMFCSAISSVTGPILVGKYQKDSFKKSS